MSDFDARVRFHVYDHFVDCGEAPSQAEVAAALDTSPEAISESFERLAEGKALVLQPESREVLMAEPFSAIPTAYVVRSKSRSWWGNCIWDALGIPAAIGDDAEVLTSCADCGEAMTVKIEGGRLAVGEGVVHFSVPVRDWWPDVAFT